MAYVQTPGGLWVPDYHFFGGALPPAFTSITLDAAADRASAVIVAPKTGNISAIKVRLGTVTALGGTSTLTVGFQGVVATDGLPNEAGGFTQSGTIATGSIVSNTTVEVTLGAVQAVTRGSRYAVVVQYGTFNAGDTVAINHAITIGTRQGPSHFDYCVNNTTGSYAKTGFPPCFSLKYDDGSYAYAPECAPIIVGGTVAYNSTSADEAIGLRYALPFPHKLGGCWLGLDADGDFDVKLYAPSATAAVTLASVDKDVRGPTVGMTGFLPFTAESAALLANTPYVLAVVPSSATNVTLSYVDVAAAAELDQLNGGQAFHYASADAPTYATDFTMTTTRRPMIGLLVTSVEDGMSGSLRTRPRLTLATHGVL